MLKILRKADWFHKDGFPIAVERREPQEPFGRHTHEFDEMVIVYGGQAQHLLGHESWTLSAGDVFLLSGRCTHEYRMVEDLRLVNILHQLDALKLDLSELIALPGYQALFVPEPGRRPRSTPWKRLRLKLDELSVLLGLVDRLEDELKRREPGFRFMATAIFMQILGYAVRCQGESGERATKALEKVGRVIARLERDFREPVSLGELAREAGMSHRQFNRAFHDATGSPPVAYVLRLRVNHAASLLRHEPDINVTEAAFRSGFSDSNFFSRQFRKALGLSPRAYRLQHAGGTPEGRHSSRP